MENIIEEVKEDVKAGSSILEVDIDSKKIVYQVEAIDVDDDDADVSECTRKMLAYVKPRCCCFDYCLVILILVIFGMVLSSFGAIIHYNVYHSTY